MVVVPVAAVFSIDSGVFIALGVIMVMPVSVNIDAVFVPGVMVVPMMIMVTVIDIIVGSVGRQARCETREGDSGQYRGNAYEFHSYVARKMR